MANNKLIKYLNRDFDAFKLALIDYTKTYFPNTYNDFTPASPGMMDIERSAYVGDVLSLYLDSQINETYLQFVQQNKNIYELAYMFSYTPKVTGVSTVNLDVYQLVPSILSGSSYVPDFNYTLKINKNAVVSSNILNFSNFLTLNDLDFSISSSADPTEITVYTISAGNPTFFLLKKDTQAISANINTINFTFGAPQRFQTILINDTKIIDILDVVDSEGNTWNKVDYLAQDVIYDSVKNTNPNDPNNFSDQGNTPYLLKLKKVQRRFVARFVDSGSIQLQFGAGTVGNIDENIIPNSDNVGLGLPFGQSKLQTAYSPTNFIFTNTYGISPSNTTLTIRYLTGGGIGANVPSNTLTQINGSINFNQNNLNNITAQSIFSSLQINNSTASDGGNDGDTLDEIKQNAISNFNTQQRNVTPDDYLIRALSMPAQFGVISKVFIEPIKIQDLGLGEIPSVLDLYILSYNSQKQLTYASLALKQNLSTYLSQNRVIGDSIKIKDAFIINIGVNIDIIVLPDWNNNDVINSCINTLIDYFDITKWSINQPIILKEIYILLDKVDGVQTVKNVEIINNTGISNGYSQYSYDVKGATINNVIYPSLDPMCWEVRYPSQDLNIRVTSI